MPTASAYPRPRRLTLPEDLEFYESRTAAGEFGLDDSEKEWRDRSEFLEARGYLLRPRFRKGWKPSWLGTNLHPRDCEDFHRLISTRLIDATRIRDGKRVVLKRVRRDANEAGLAQSLHVEGGSENPDNCCVPILEYFDDENDRTLGFLVMPLLRRYNAPPFAFISEVIDFIRQTLTGLRYLHHKKVAHRDLSSLNIMMDGDPLYPQGFHPSHQFLNPVASADAKHLDRRDVPFIKYYIIDFGNSSAFDEKGRLIEEFKVYRESLEISVDDGSSSNENESELDAEAIAAIKARFQKLDPTVDLEGIEHVIAQPTVEELPPFMVTGKDALDREVPELSSHVPYDPFGVDIFTLGNVYKKDFLLQYSNLEFLAPLVTSMTQRDPKMRPSVEDAIQHFESITAGMKRLQLCLPLRSVEEPLGRYSMAFKDTKATIREYWVLSKERIKKLLFFPWFYRRGLSNAFPRFRRSASASN